jgi:predicted RNase H-like nuclease (RuvC/YqgF family)
MSEADIKILENKLKQWEPYKNTKFPTPIEKEIQKENRAIENLLNKYKEQEKIIELMAKDIAENKLNEDICAQVKDPKKVDCYGFQYGACYGCVIEYYEKKAKE